MPAKGKAPRTAAQMLTALAADCSQRERSAYEVRQKLTAAGISEEEQAQIIARLVQQGFIDEYRFCRSFAHDRLTHHQWGRVRIAIALKQRCTDAAARQAALEGLDEATYHEALTSLLAKKQRLLHESDERVRYAKLFNFALSHGFEPDEIGATLRASGLSSEEG